MLEHRTVSPGPLLRPLLRLLPGLLSGLLCLPLYGLEIKVGEIRNRAIFGIDFPGHTRSYYAQEKAVQSVSLQEYITAAFQVIEINIVTAGDGLLRIYHSRPMSAGELKEAATGAARSTGAPGAAMIRSPLPESIESRIDESAEQAAESLTDSTVIKEYPVATHSRTIEFRVRSRSELLALYEELRQHLAREPAFYENGRIVQAGETTETEERQRSLGGTLFIVEK